MGCEFGFWERGRVWLVISHMAYLTHTRIYTPKSKNNPGAKEGATSGGGNRNSLSSAAALLLTPQGLGQYQRLFHTRVLDYEPLVAVVVEMLQGADSCIYTQVFLFLGGSVVNWRNIHVYLTTYHPYIDLPSASTGASLLDDLLHAYSDAGNTTLYRPLLKAYFAQASIHMHIYIHIYSIKYLYVCVVYITRLKR